MSTEGDEIARSYEEVFDQRLQYLAEGLRTAAAKIAEIREGRYASEVHPITGKRRLSPGALAAHRAVDEATGELRLIHQFAALADMAWFPQTQEM